MWTDKICSKESIFTEELSTSPRMVPQTFETAMLQRLIYFPLTLPAPLLLPPLSDFLRIANMTSESQGGAWAIPIQIACAMASFPPPPTCLLLSQLPTAGWNVNCFSSSPPFPKHLSITREGGAVESRKKNAQDKAHNILFSVSK